MVKSSKYAITTFQRKPGLWRSSVLLTGTATSDRKMQSILTAEDSSSEKDAELAALRMIRLMEEEEKDEKEENQEGQTIR